MKWSQKTRQLAEPIYQKTIHHPFIRELMSGTLKQPTFLFYLQQDALYLAEYGRILSGIASKLPQQHQIDVFLGFAKDTLIVEQQLHHSYLQFIEDCDEIKPSPTCLLYTSYLAKQFSRYSPAIAVAAVLPCFWIYKDVGDYILQQQKQHDNPYQDWINTYSSDAFAEAVSKAIAIADELANESTEQQSLMTDAFLTATKLEYLFWDSAYRLEQWPI